MRKKIVMGLERLSSILELVDKKCNDAESLQVVMASDLSLDEVEAVCEKYIKKGYFPWKEEDKDHKGRYVFCVGNVESTRVRERREPQYA